ncbi:AMP-dependent synthetase [Alcanivorax sp. N3-2A]|nr:AMP-dependent synthetase [Alcanivorax sp. N3-2A]|tara:strand:+ start:4616 stop:6349 length:1734 start_codon:yes stop_codon:yes gene_type:complete
MTPETAFSRLLEEGDMVLDNLDACVARHPDKTFIYYGEDDLTLSFKAFKAKSDALAAALIGLGVEPDDRVSVLSRNSLVAALSMFAIWRAGAVYAPVNFNYTGRLLSYQLDDTAPKALIVDVNLAPAVDEILAGIEITEFIVHDPVEGAHDHQGVALPVGLAARNHHDFAALATPGPVPEPVPRRYDDIANIIYTSGTTGPSKGVVQSFRWINQYNFLPRAFNNADDVLYCDLPMYHVGGAFSQFARAVWHGNTVGLWDRFSPTRFWDRVARCQATACVLLDVMVPWLMSPPARTDDRHNTLNKVHMQPLPPSNRAVAQRFGFDFVTAGFGQTETGAGFLVVIDQFGDQPGTPTDLYAGLSKSDVRAAAAELNALIIDGAGEIPKGLMGRPSPLLEAAILDPQDNPCPPGEVGQLAFRPRFPSLIIQEYFNKPGKTLEAFRNLWFHTGDACYRDPHDSYFFVDRMGGYLRVRGENVSSYEVEDLINMHPHIQVSAAIPVPAAEGSEEDIGIFIQVVEGESLDLAAVGEHCASVMPRYMVPRHIRLIDEMPLTPTGKIEKYKLRQQLLKEIGNEMESG